MSRKAFLVGHNSYRLDRPSCNPFNQILKDIQTTTADTSVNNQKGNAEVLRARPRKQGGTYKGLLDILKFFCEGFTAGLDSASMRKP